jgi:hypothetical protein
MARPLAGCVWPETVTLTRQVVTATMPQFFMEEALTSSELNLFETHANRSSKHFQAAECANLDAGINLRANSVLEVPPDTLDRAIA